MRGVILYLCDRMVVGDALSRSLCYNVNCVLKSNGTVIWLLWGDTVRGHSVSGTV